jgi:hypothetical protein
MAVGRRCVRGAVGDKVGDPSADMCCGEGVEFVEGLVDRVAEDVGVDYRKPSLVEDIRAALLEGQKLMFALGAASGKGNYENICKALSTGGGKLAMVLPPDPGKRRFQRGLWRSRDRWGWLLMS